MTTEQIRERKKLCRLEKLTPYLTLKEYAIWTRKGTGIPYVPRMEPLIKEPDGNKEK